MLQNLFRASKSTADARNRGPCTGREALVRDYLRISNRWEFPPKATYSCKVVPAPSMCCTHPTLSILPETPSAALRTLRTRWPLPTVLRVIVEVAQQTQLKHAELLG